MTTLPVHKTGSPLRNIAVRTLWAGVTLLALAYVADYGLFQYRVTIKHQPLGSITVQHYYSIAHKDGKTELIFDPPMQQPCAPSLFPHAGNPPCWYLTRHSEPVTNM